MFRASEHGYESGRSKRMSESALKVTRRSGHEALPHHLILLPFHGKLANPLPLFFLSPRLQFGSVALNQGLRLVHDKMAKGLFASLKGVDAFGKVRIHFSRPRNFVSYTTYQTTEDVKVKTRTGAFRERLKR